VYDPDPEILEISRALGDGTRLAIYRRIANSDHPTTVKELVEALGLHHSAIRIHLRKLQESGLIVSAKLGRHGMVGRPELVFTPGHRPVRISLPPRNYEFIAHLALDLATQDHMDPAVAESFGVEWGRRYVRTNGGGHEVPRDLDQALGALCQMLSSLGGDVRMQASNGDGYALIERNCLFSDLAVQHHPAVCLLHQAAIKGMLSELSGSDYMLEQTASLAAGDDLCVTRIAPTAAAGYARAD
jgi:predicted ArsR family transcriptional regulator